MGIHCDVTSLPDTEAHVTTQLLDPLIHGCLLRGKGVIHVYEQDIRMWLALKNER